MSQLRVADGTVRFRMGALVFVCLFVRHEGNFGMVRTLCVFLFLASSVMAQTPFPVRNVVSGQVATVPKGDYLLTVQCNVRPGGKLVIEAGANIKVDGPGIVFYNQGTLEINGTETEPVQVSPIPGKNCGTLFCPWTSGPRPQLLVSHLSWTSTINANCLFLQATDFAITNSTITNRAVTTAASRVCVSLNTGSIGTISASTLDGCSPEIAKPSKGLVVNRDDVVDLLNVIINRTTEPVDINKASTLVSGSIE